MNYESIEKEVTISFEHSEYKWARFEDSLKQLSFENTKTILNKAHQEISTKYFNLIK